MKILKIFVITNKLTDFMHLKSFVLTYLISHRFSCGVFFKKKSNWLVIYYPWNQQNRSEPFLVEQNVCMSLSSPTNTYWKDVISSWCDLKYTCSIRRFQCFMTSAEVSTTRRAEFRHVLPKGFRHIFYGRTLFLSWCDQW